MANGGRVLGIILTEQEPDEQLDISPPRAVQLIWVVLGVVESMFALRIVLTLSGVDTNILVVNLVYALTNVFLAPLTRLITLPVTVKASLDFYALFAMLVYFVIAWTVEGVIWLMFSHRRSDID